MDRQFSVLCDDEVAAEIEALARENDLSHEEVLRQLVVLGLEAVDGHRRGDDRSRERLAAGGDPEG